MHSYVIYEWDMDWMCQRKLNYNIGKEEHNIIIFIMFKTTSEGVWPVNSEPLRNGWMKTK